MTAILRDLPFHDHDDEIVVGRERVRIKPYQIVFWVSLTNRGLGQLSPNAPRFPVILDTGHNHNFSINQKHMSLWSGLESALYHVNEIRSRSETIPRYAADVWIHPNMAGQRDAFTEESPLLVGVRGGIAVHPHTSSFPRLPLLGLRALVQNKLHFTMDPERCLVSLRTPDWRTKLLRWFR